MLTIYYIFLIQKTLKFAYKSMLIKKTLFNTNIYSFKNYLNMYLKATFVGLLTISVFYNIL